MSFGIFSKWRTGKIARGSFLDMPNITSVTNLGISGCFSGRINYRNTWFLVKFESPKAFNNSCFLLKRVICMPVSVLQSIWSSVPSA